MNRNLVSDTAYLLSQMISQQTLSRPKIQRGKRRARKKKIISHQHQQTNAPAVVMDQKSVGSLRKPKSGRELQSSKYCRNGCCKSQEIAFCYNPSKVRLGCFSAEGGTNCEAKGIINWFEKYANEESIVKRL